MADMEHNFHFYNEAINSFLFCSEKREQKRGEWRWRRIEKINRKFFSSFLLFKWRRGKRRKITQKPPLWMGRKKKKKSLHWFTSCSLVLLLYFQFMSDASRFGSFASAEHKHLSFSSQQNACSKMYFIAKKKSAARLITWLVCEVKKAHTSGKLLRTKWEKLISN